MIRVLASTDPAEVAHVDALVAAAFQDDGARVAGLVTALRSCGHVLLELVAEVDGIVVGHVLLSRAWIDARERMVEVATLSPLSVRPESQGRGAGTDLLAEVLDAAEKLDLPAVLLEGAPGYYGARGFRPASELGVERPSLRIPAPAFQVAALEAWEPWMRGRLVYCEPFWTHDCVGLRDPDLAALENLFAEQ